MASEWRDKCTCGSGLGAVALNDTYGIFCCWVCEVCEDDKRSKYRPEIFTSHYQPEYGESIEEI